MAVVKVSASSEDCAGGSGNGETGGRAPDEEASVLTKLTRTIEGEVIPRLLLAHVLPKKAKQEDSTDWVMDPQEVQKFGELIIGCDSRDAFQFVNEARDAGRPLENIITKLLAPAATYLGELWKADRCSFTEVTVGLSRLRQILRELGPEFENEKGSWRHGRRALLLPVPGEKHTFGVYVVEAFFRREGWDVYGGPVDTDTEIAHLVEKQWFAIAGFSLSSGRLIEKLPPLIKAIRRKSCNESIAILVGGPFFLSNPNLVKEVGADGSAIDAREAVAQASTLLSRVSAKI
jgi:methanogenic corrinoid protein MtbC1